MHQKSISKLMVAEGMPLQVANLSINFTAYPLEIIEGETADPDKYYSVLHGEGQIEYVNASYEEGVLNVYIFRFVSGKCQMHFFGKMKGEDFFLEREVGRYSAFGFIKLKEMIKFVLTKSRMVFKTYYRDKDFKSMEKHLMAFLHEL